MQKFITNYLKNISLVSLLIIVFINMYFSSYNLFDDWFIIAMIIIFLIIWVYFTIEAYKQAKQYDTELFKEPLVIKEMYNPIRLIHSYEMRKDILFKYDKEMIEITNEQSKYELLKNVKNLIITETEELPNGNMKISNTIYIYKKV